MSSGFETEYKKYISEKLNLELGLDFLNSRDDVRLAEEVIKERGLEKKYFDELSSSLGKPRPIQSWEVARIEKPYRRASSIVKILQGED